MSFPGHCWLFLSQLLVTLHVVSTHSEWAFQKPIQASYLVQWANSTFRQATADLEFLRNTSLLFVGDSVTRYQYMYLIQFLHRRQWDDVDGNQLCCERHYGSFVAMFRAYPHVFGCSHICDCVDHHGPNAIRRNGTVVRFENHFYFNASLWVHASYYPFFGTDLGLTFFQRTPSPKDFEEYCAGFPETAKAHLSPEARATVPSVQRFLADVLSLEGHRVLVFNFGIWRHSDAAFFTPEGLDAFAAAAHAAAPIAVWRTTTAVWRHGPIDGEPLLEGLRRRGFHIFDAHKLTSELLQLGHRAMWDEWHFQAFVYRELNVALLEFLRVLLAVPSK